MVIIHRDETKRREFTLFLQDFAKLHNTIIAQDNRYTINNT